MVGSAVPGRVELLSIGTELVRHGRVDEHASWLAERLGRVGFEVACRSVVDDDPARIASLVRSSGDRAELLLATGGLGPTADDRTREGLAEGFGLALESDPEEERRLVERFARRGRVPGPDHLRQAERPAGADWLDNPVGTAAGLWLSIGGRIAVALPGVPEEMRAMFDRHVLPRLAKSGRGVAVRRRLAVAGRTESSVDRKLADLFSAPGVELTLLAGAGGVEVLLHAVGDEQEAGRRLDALEAVIRGRLGPDLYGSGEESLASVVGGLLLRAGQTLATAESCTAGLLAATLTEVPGASAWFLGGLVTYADDVKIGLAGIDRRVLERHGAVSAEVAVALGRAARGRCGASLALAVTGIAGPGGGTSTKPVGQVHVALVDGRQIRAREFHAIGDRTAVRRRAVVAALDLLRRHLLGLPVDT